MAPHGEDGRLDGEKPPLVLQIIFLAKHLDHLIEQRLSLRDLNRTQGIILIALSRHDGLKALDLCAHARVEPANVTRTLQALERQGLAERRPHPTDGRASLFYPTDAGRSLAAEVDREMRALSARLFHDVPQEDMLALEKGLCVAWAAIRSQFSGAGHPRPAFCDQQSAASYQTSSAQSSTSGAGSRSHAHSEIDNFDVERR